MENDGYKNKKILHEEAETLKTTRNTMPIYSQIGYIHGNNKNIMLLLQFSQRKVSNRIVFSLDVKTRSLNIEYQELVNSTVTWRGIESFSVYTQK